MFAVLLAFPFVAVELTGGNIHLLLAAAIVAEFRWPAAWSFVLLTKVTPGIGLLWFAVRREWRPLMIALGATAAIAGLTFIIVPGARPYVLPRASFLYRCALPLRLCSSHGVPVEIDAGFCRLLPWSRCRVRGWRAGLCSWQSPCLRHLANARHVRERSARLASLRPPEPADPDSSRNRGLRQGEHQIELYLSSIAAAATTPQGSPIRPARAKATQASRQAVPSTAHHDARPTR